MRPQWSRKQILTAMNGRAGVTAEPDVMIANPDMHSSTAIFHWQRIFCFCFFVSVLSRGGYGGNVNSNSPDELSCVKPTLAPRRLNIVLFCWQTDPRREREYRNSFIGAPHSSPPPPPSTPPPPPPPLHCFFARAEC